MRAGVGSMQDSTNNVAEIMGIVDGLRAALNEIAGRTTPTQEPSILGDHQLTIISDSQYAIGVCSGKHNAKTNLEAVAAARQALQNLRPFNVATTFAWIKGHSGTDKWHDRADSLAVTAKKQEQERHNGPK